jgi:hypothetical protein
LVKGEGDSLSAQFTADMALASSQFWAQADIGLAPRRLHRRARSFMGEEITAFGGPEEFWGEE